MSQPPQSDFVLAYDLEGASHEYALTDARLVIGRAKDCNLCFPFNAEISRLHATLTLTPDGWQIEDMNSRSGTLVNGERLAGRRVLRDRDVLSIGTVTLTLREKKHQLETVTGDAALSPELLAAVTAQGPAHPAAVPATGAGAARPPSDAAASGAEAAASSALLLNYYELIGVPNFEDDVAKIQLAAKNRLAALRAESATGTSPQRQSEVEAIAGGLASLASPEKKSAYDAALAERLGVEFEMRGGRVVPVERASVGQLLAGFLLFGVIIVILWFTLSWMLDSLLPMLDVTRQR
jgi:predicted component of type VI protein secretion system